MAVRPLTPLTPLLLLLAPACAAMGPLPETAPVTTQFAFFGFTDDQVRVTVDGRTVFDRAVTVAADNARSGLAAVAQIDLPDCADVVVTSKSGRAAERVCRTPETKSVVIAAGPPLTIEAQDRYQGVD